MPRPAMAPLALGLVALGLLGGLGEVATLAGALGSAEQFVTVPQKFEPLPPRAQAVLAADGEQAFSATQRLIRPHVRQGGILLNAAEGLKANRSDPQEVLSDFLSSEVSDDASEKSKVCLIFLFVTGGHWFGLDYFYMGNTWLGFAHLALTVLTGGIAGFFWAVARWVVVMLSCWNLHTSIGCMGFDAHFGCRVDVDTARTVAVVSLAFATCAFLMTPGLCWKMGGRPSSA